MISQDFLDQLAPGTWCLLQTKQGLDQLTHKGRAIRSKYAEAFRLVTVQVKVRVQLTIEKGSFNIQLPNKHITMSEGRQENSEPSLKGDLDLELHQS